MGGARGDVEPGYAASMKIIPERASARLRRHSSFLRRPTLTLLDQCVASISNVFVGIGVGRLTGSANLGGFTLAYAWWLTLGALHRAMVTDPMAIEEDAVGPESKNRIQRAFATALLLGVAAAVLFALSGVLLLVAGQRIFATGMLAVSPFIPFLVLQDFWRRVGFMIRKPGKTLANDALFDLVQGLCFTGAVLGGVRSAPLMIASWGMGAVAGALFGFAQFRVPPAFRGGVSLIRERWALIKWLTAVAVVGTGTAECTSVIGGAVLGPAGLGGLNAAQTLVTGPAMVLIQAQGSIGLPEASRALAQRGWAGLSRVARWVMAAGVITTAASAAVVVVASHALLKLIYGPEFAHFWLAADVMAFGLFINSFAIGPILVLKATKRPRPLFVSQVISLAALVVPLPVLGILYGVTGAADAILLSAVGTVVPLLIAQRAVRKSYTAEKPIAPEVGSEIAATQPVDAVGLLGQLMETPDRA